jgi:phage endonuclease
MGHTNVWLFVIFEREGMMKPQKLTILGGRRTSVDYDQRNNEYTEYNRTRWKYDKDVKRFYNSSIWKRTSKQVLLESDYVCAMCGDEATMTDHIISVKQDWSRRLDRNNLQASCKKCNDKKAIKERYSF